MKPDEEIRRRPPQRGGLLQRYAERSAYASVDVPIAPFQYPSLEHLDRAVSSVIERRENLQTISPTTAGWAGAAYRGFRRFLAGHPARSQFLAGDLSTQVALLEDWIIAMRARGMRRGGINTTWRGLASVFRWLTHGRGIVNPVRFVDAPKVGRLQPSFLPRDAAEQVLRFVRNRLWRSEFERRRNSVMIGLMLLAGLRRGEVIRLRRQDVRLQTGALLLRRTKGKNGGGMRTAHMPPQLRTLVAEYIEALRELPPRRHPELLTSERNAPLSPAAITRVCRIISKESGIHIAPHMLRHSYATLLRQSGVPDRLAMELMGHADLRMLLRYSHVEADEARRAAEGLQLDD